MSWPQPTRADHQKFCTTEGWEQVRDARGRAAGHHITYRLLLPDGRVLRTRISHPPDRSTYGPSIWSHILRNQLDVTEEQFWRCANDGIAPDRGYRPLPENRIPADVVYLLVNRVGLPEKEIAQLSRQEAIARLQRYWTEQT